MPLTRDAIISTLQAELAACPQVIAMWLEGADAVGMVDEYSDIDVCCSVDAGAMELVASRAQQALESLGTLDLIQRTDHGSAQQQTVFHLNGTPPYLLVDFNLYVACGSVPRKGVTTCHFKQSGG